MAKFRVFPLFNRESPTGAGSLQTAHTAIQSGVSGAIPAVMPDVGFPLEALKGIPLLARTAGLIPHVKEEMERPVAFRLAEVAEAAVT
jgi:citrate synthase